MFDKFLIKYFCRRSFQELNLSLRLLGMKNLTSLEEKISQPLPKKIQQLSSKLSGRQRVYQLSGYTFKNVKRTYIGIRECVRLFFNKSLGLATQTQTALFKKLNSLRDKDIV